MRVRVRECALLHAPCAAVFWYLMMMMVVRAGVGGRGGDTQVTTGHGRARALKHRAGVQQSTHLRNERIQFVALSELN